MRDDAGKKGVISGLSTHDTRKNNSGDVYSNHFDTYVLCRIF